MAFISDTPLPTLGSTTPSALDFSSLNSLKRGVQTNPQSQEQLRQVARQFEAMFIQMLMKQARQTSRQMPSLFDSQATRFAQSLSDEQASLALANPGIGLADALMAQMQGGVLMNNPAGSQADSSGKSDARIPWRQLSRDDGQRQAADSITALIDLLNRKDQGQKVVGAIRGAPEHIRSFVDQMALAADTAAQRSGVPAKLILSQAALESGWGQREILRPDGSSSHNLFGIKASGGWRGEVVKVMTTEYVDGRPRKMLQPFRAYDSYTDSFTDYANLLSGSERYSQVLEARSAEDAARKVQAAGYATDPSYASKLISIMGYFHAR